MQNKQLIHYISDTSKPVKKQSKIKLSQEQESKIHSQLLNQIYQEIEQQFKQELKKIQSKINNEYEQALQELQREASVIKKQQTKPLCQQIHNLKNKIANQEQSRYAMLYHSFVEKCFSERLMQHPDIKKIESNLIKQIQAKEKASYQSEVERKKKNIFIQIQNKQEKEKKKIDERIRESIVKDKKVEQMKKRVHEQQMRIAALRSELNIKINNIESQIKKTQTQMSAELKKIAGSDSIESLKEQLKILKAEKQERDKRKLLLEACELKDQEQQMKQKYDQKDQNFAQWIIENQTYQSVDEVVLFNQNQAMNIGRLLRFKTDSNYKEDQIENKQNRYSLANIIKCNKNNDQINDKALSCRLEPRNHRQLSKKSRETILANICRLDTDYSLKSHLYSYE